MKTRSSFALSVVLGLALLHSTRAQCDLSTDATTSKEFPDINTEGKLSYQLSVEFTVTNDEVKETSFYREYRDIQNNKGRVDMIASGNTTKYYYFKDTGEVFEIQADNCKTGTMDMIPSFMKEAMTDWEYSGNVRGPSAMFLNARDTWKNNRKNMVYMGETAFYIRGLKAQYWRLCRDDQVIDYYFTDDDHDDVFGFDTLKQIPLRVSFGDSKKEPKFFPQTYDIISFQPFVSNRIDTLAVPAGLGCRRNVIKLVDVPKVPDFNGQNLFTFGEASYVYDIDKPDTYKYYSTFMYALDVLTDHMSYFYTPWGGVGTKDGVPDSFTHVTYDTKQKYVYRNNLGNDTCTISRESQFIPRYYLPAGRGYIDITDPMMLYPNNEFRYLSDGKDRGYDVHIFEAVMENYSLGNRTVPKVIVTHNYMKDTEVIDNNVVVRNTSLSIVFKFYADPGKPHNEQLTINLYGFTTQIEHPQFVFSIGSCMKNDDDFLYATIGFAADKKVQNKIQTEIPAIQNDILQEILRVSQLNALRVPNILVDFDDMIYVTVTILDRPLVSLDFLEPEADKTISSERAEGDISLDGCAIGCLESESNCWGYAYCGATCHYGTATSGAVVPKAGCKLYRRFSNESAIPTKENAANQLKILVDGNQFKIGVPSIKDSSEMPEFLEASYFAITAPGESEEIFGLLGQRTDPRLRVVKVAAKLDHTGQQVKNFGTLRYDQCQQLCLDFRRCETVSYCVKDSQCVLSLTYIEDIKPENIKEDTFCNLLAKKYAAHFDRTAGSILSQNAKKTLPSASPEDCARACLREKDFDCVSFDVCGDSNKDPCRLHANRLSDVNKETGVSKQTSCGHYSKKFSYKYKRQENLQSVGLGVLTATNINLEECAKRCDQFESGCFGYDFCADKTLSSTSCYLLNDNPANYKTTYSAICTHFVQADVLGSDVYSPTSAAWVGAVAFFVAAVIGVLVTFGVGYYRANRAS